MSITSSVATNVASVATVASVECPECAAQIALVRQPLLSEVVRCGDCSVELEITGISPLTVEVAPEVEEDWGE